jgi:hypothetical protein
MKTLAAIIIALLDPEENPYVFRPLVYWAIAIFCLIAPFLFSDRWRIQSALATIPVYWLLALMAFASGLGSLQWRHAKGGRDGKVMDARSSLPMLTSISLYRTNGGVEGGKRRAEAADCRIRASTGAD